MMIRKAVFAAAATVLAVGATTLAAQPAQAATYYYGALALNASTGSVGVANDSDSYSDADAYALADCVGSCSVVVRFVNGCGAIAESSRYWGYGSGDSLWEAENEALVSAHGGGIYTWACTAGHS